MSETPVCLVIHGGAGPLKGGDYSRETAHMRGLIEAGRDRLQAGAAALEDLRRLAERGPVQLVRPFLRPA